MGRLKRYTRPSKIRAIESKGKRNVAPRYSRGRRCVTPMKKEFPRSYLNKKSWSKCLGRVLSPVSEGDFSPGRVLKPHYGRSFEAQSPSQIIPSKSTLTTSIKDSCQDSASMILPSGVSSFLMDCMDLDSEPEETLSSIETVRNADIYDEGTGLISDDEILHFHVKNSTLLDLSHAVDIANQKSPNLSSILELSPVIDRQGTEESSALSPPRPWSPLGLSPLAGPSKKLGSSKNTPGREITAVGFEETTPVTIRAVELSPVMKKRRQTCEVQKSRACTLRENATGGVRRQLVTAQEPPLESAKFFDFIDESDREAFFQRLKLNFTFQFPSKLITFTDLPSTEDL